MNSDHPKINVLGGYASLSGEVLPAENALKPSLNKRAICRECGNEIVQANDGEWIHPDRQLMHVASPKPEPKYDPKLDNIDIPQEVYDAAMLVSNYFDKRFGPYGKWQFMGLQKRI